MQCLRARFNATGKKTWPCYKPTKNADFFTTTTEITNSWNWSQNANPRPKFVHWGLETEQEAVFVHVRRTFCFSVSNATVIVENSCCIKWPTALSLSLSLSTLHQLQVSPQSSIEKTSREEQNLVSYLKERVTGFWRMTWCKSWLKRHILAFFKALAWT